MATLKLFDYDMTGKQLVFYEDLDGDVFATIVPSSAVSDGGLEVDIEEPEDEGAVGITFSSHCSPVQVYEDLDRIDDTITTSSDLVTGEDVEDVLASVRALDSASRKEVLKALLKDSFV